MSPVYINVNCVTQSITLSSVGLTLFTGRVEPGTPSRRRPHPNGIVWAWRSVIPPTGNTIAEETGGAIRFALNSRACFSPRRTNESLITLLFWEKKKKERKREREKKKHLLVFWCLPESKRSPPPPKKSDQGMEMLITASYIFILDLILCNEQGVSD